MIHKYNTNQSIRFYYNQKNAFYSIQNIGMVEGIQFIKKNLYHSLSKHSVSHFTKPAFCSFHVVNNIHLNQNRTSEE
jgi:hypothetical protein